MKSLDTFFDPEIPRESQSLLGLLSIKDQASREWEALPLSEIFETILDDYIHEEGGCECGSSPPTLREALCSDSPNRGQLIAVKNFAKSNLSAMLGSALSPQISTALYYISAAAGVGFQVPLTSLSSKQLVAGWRWALSLNWLDSHVRRILEEAIRVASQSQDQSA